MTEFPCPRCGVSRETLDADCAECGWSAAPTRTPREDYVPRRFKKTEWFLIVAVGVIGMVLGVVRGTFLLGPPAALFLAPICFAYSVTIAVLIVEVIALFSQKTGRPQFNLRFLFVFTAACAVLLVVARLLMVRRLDDLFDWPFSIRLDGLEIFVMLLVGLSAWTWCLTVPAGLAYNAIGLSRHRPAPFFAYVFLATTLCFMTLLLLPLVGMWQNRGVASCSLIMGGAAAAFVVESFFTKTKPAHRRRAMVAVLIALQSYLALVGLFWAIAGMTV